MKKFGIIFLLCVLASSSMQAQSQADKPKLIVGIVVDQMRQEYLYRFADRYSDGGFKRMMKDGFMMKNGHYNYIPTYTGPGHASVYTGTTPATHGIIGNDWYVKSLDRMIYCAEDTLVTNVGGSAENGFISPRNLLTTTITDELRISTQKRSKVVGVAIKDRGASMPAGHLGDAYWFDTNTGEFMTSTYYHDKLPEWVEKFNAKKSVDSYLSQTWNTLYPIETYTASMVDDNPFEGKFSGKDTPTFPYDLKELRQTNGDFGLVSATPFGNSMTLDFAIAALEGEKMGMGEDTDFLALSFSSPDYIGHRFGPQSKEVEDNYLRLDQDIERLLNYLDKTYGKDNYVVFLSADHAVAEIATHMVSENVPGGNVRTGIVNTELLNYLSATYGEGDWIKNSSNGQLFLNHELIHEKKLTQEDLENEIALFLLKFDGIKEVYTGTAMRTSAFTKGRAELLQMGYNHKSSGDIMIILEPGWLTGGATGTSHGTGYTYDTNVPILFYGWNVPAGESSRYATITDIAPTLSMMLNIKLPNGATGQPILEITDKK
ncbi:type I phosphodiesterase/nucleotide pyrophosphatase [Algoriphagus ratkowskyi]|uniref:Alkaline phosphatase family protein n=1 Tax=Algoriphagus ratkowskyi TaxID=57028 RepID=A0A2W7T7J5_9BACT|nr:alkaline phosphatase PafA [Algoriphagus ratkowskyi]PZX59202.1 type I phosphodiesterase/nucleotide pyrophosphatase [Algoriphagus ratkowskyi]TXD77515.1 alkaline phosphatase family protein [Algoriphagus ratkowskyi]